MGRLARATDHICSEIEAADWTDRAGYKLEHLFALGLNLFGPATDRVRDGLNGTWFGHPVHPPLTDVAIGAWTTAMAFDAADVVRPDSPRTAALRAAAQTSVGIGVLGAAGSAVTGMADWQYTHDNARRVGLAHGLMNVTATGLFTASWLNRRRGRHGRGRAASTAGYLIASAGAYLGGTLVSRHRIGVDHAEHGFEPRDFVPVLDRSALPDGKPCLVDADGVGVVLVQAGGGLHAFGEQCPHLGGPLSQGRLHGDALECPWHGSRFALDDGTVARGPATAPLPCFETRIRAGRVEVRRRPPVPSATPGSVVVREQEHPGAGNGSTGPMAATAVLRAHHDQLRELMRALREVQRPVRERERVLDVLVSEMSLHEQIEDEIFYPAMRDVSALVTVSHAEHRQLDDQVVVVLRTGVGGDGFPDEFDQLTSSFEHHAGLEESQMFPEAEDKVSATQLDELGVVLSDRLQQLRDSKITRMRLRAKTALIRRL